MSDPNLLSPSSAPKTLPVGISPRLLQPFGLALSLAYFHHYTPPAAGRRILAALHLRRLAQWHNLIPAPDLCRHRALALQLALLHAARLLDLTAPVLRPGPRAGDWLRAPAAEQTRRLRAAATDDRPQTADGAFSLSPPIVELSSPVDELPCPTGDPLRAVAVALGLAAAVTPDVAAWAVQYLARSVAPPAAPRPAALAIDADCWRLRLAADTSPDVLFDLLQLGQWRPLARDGGELTLTPRSVARAARRGYGPEPAIHAVETALGRPLMPEHCALWRRWAGRGRAYRLRVVCLLETAHDHQLAGVLAQRRLRSHVLRLLSPRHAVVRPAIAPLLHRRLAAQGYLLDDESGVASGERVAAGDEPARHSSPVAHHASSAHVWLALRVLIGLGEIAPLPVPPPHEALEAAAVPLSPVELGELEEIAARFLDEWRAALRGRDAFLPAGRPPDPALLHAVRDALRDGRTLRIDYHPPGGSDETGAAGVATRPCASPRLVRPLWLEQRGDLYYLHAYCYRAEAERTFRLDRVTSYE